MHPTLYLPVQRKTMKGCVSSTFVHTTFNHVYLDSRIHEMLLRRIRSESSGGGKGAAKRNGIGVSGSYKYFDAETEKVREWQYCLVLDHK